MKRFTILFMLFIYLLFNARVSYSMHFCGSKLISSEFFIERKDCVCSPTPEKKASHCCEDLKVESGTDEQQQSSYIFKLNIEKVLLSEIKFFVFELNYLNRTPFVQRIEDLSPSLYKVPLFIFNQIFRL
jgi:hypothetical protein